MSCLVTTLKGVVNDDNLLCMGDIVLDAAGSDAAESNNFPAIFVSYNSACKCIAFGGNFVSPSGESLGSEITINPAGGTFIASPEVKRIVLRGGYSCLTLRPQTTSSTGAYFSIDNRYLPYQINISTLSVGNKSPLKFNGNIADFIESHSGVISFTYSDYSETIIPLGAFKSLKQLVSLNLNGTLLAGSTDDLAEVVALESVFLGYRSPDAAITGDLSKLPAKVSVFSAQETSDVYSWKTQRSTDTCPISLLSVRFGNDIDAAIINMAACTREPPSTVSKRMTLIGTRTSASDAAVAALQAKGWTITVTEA